MKIKLKDLDKKLPRDNNHSGIDVKKWIKLNKGNIIEVENVPELCKDLVVEIKDAPKKSVKPKVKKELKGDK